MTHMAPRILKGDLNPGFFIKHYIKDMDIATEEVSKVALDLQLLNEVLEMYRVLDEKGLGDLGIQALIKYYDKEQRIRKSFKEKRED